MATRERLDERNAVTRESRQRGAFYCEADIEYWRERKATYVPVKRLVLVKKPLYFNNIKQDTPWIWQVDRRETNIDISDWEMSNIAVTQTGSSLRKGPRGTHCLDWCSTAGISSWLLGHSHETVTTVECRKELKTIAQTNLNKFKTDFYKQQFIELNCNIHDAHEVAKAIEWNKYDTIRLGSSSCERIYEAIRLKITRAKVIYCYNPGPRFIQTMTQDGWAYMQNLKASDYFAKD